MQIIDPFFILVWSQNKESKKNIYIQIIFFYNLFKNSNNKRQYVLLALLFIKIKFEYLNNLPNNCKKYIKSKQSEEKKSCTKS